MSNKLGGCHKMEIGSVGGWLAVGAVIAFIIIPVFWLYVFKKGEE